MRTSQIIPWPQDIPIRLTDVRADNDNQEIAFRLASTLNAGREAFQVHPNRLEVCAEQLRFKLGADSQAKDQAEVPRWDWVSAVPQGAVRAELLSATLPRDTLARFVPEFRHQPIRLVSKGPAPGPVRIANVGGLEVANVAQLLAALDQVGDDKERVQVDFINEGVPTGRGVTAVEFEPQALVALCNTVASDQPVVRTAEANNPWLIIREGGVRCKLTARLEKEHGLLHVVLSTTSCWGNQQLQPKEVRAFCDGQPLRCLSVADTLEVLYGNFEPSADETDQRAYSFAAVSERDDYLIPTNYKTLEQKTAAVYRKTAAPLPLPALATVPGEVYPGPAILGDARALTGFLLQRQLLQPGDREQTGWIMFAGPSLRDGGAVEIDIDLDSGPRRIRLNVPSS